MDRKFTGIEHILRFLRRIGLQKQPGQAEVFVKISSPQVSAIFPQISCIFPQICAIDLFVNFASCSASKSYPLHQTLESPTFELESLLCRA